MLEPTHACIFFFFSFHFFCFSFTLQAKEVRKFGIYHRTIWCQSCHFLAFSFLGQVSENEDISSLSWNAFSPAHDGLCFCIIW